MIKTKKTAAAMLTLSFLLTGCAGKSSKPVPNDTGSPEDRASQTASGHDAADNVKQPSAKEDEAMLLEHDVPFPESIGKVESVV